MRNIVKAALVALVLALAAPAMAQEDKPGLEAFQGGEYSVALREWREQAEKGKAEAQAILGTLYFLGLVGLQDHAEAAMWWSKSYENSAKPSNSVGAKKIRKKLSKLFEGDYVLPGYSEAFRLLLEAADRGVATAQYSLGYIYSAGLGVPQDFAEATKWWLKSAEQGIAGGQYALGLMYIEGLGVPQHYVRAHMWLNLAASQGIEKAAKVRDDLADDDYMSHEQVAEAQQLAVEWRPR